MDWRALSDSTGGVVPQTSSPTKCHYYHPNKFLFSNFSEIFKVHRRREIFARTVQHSHWRTSHITRYFWTTLSWKRCCEKRRARVAVLETSVAT